MEITTAFREASVSKSLSTAFEWAEKAFEAGLEGDNYISPSKHQKGWVVDVRNHDGQVIGYLRSCA